MGIKTKITKTEHGKLSDDVKKLYKVDGSDDGVFHLEVDGKTASEKKALDVRDDLRKELDTWKSKFQGVDPDKYKELAEQVKTLQAKADEKDSGGDKTAKQIAKLTEQFAEEKAARLKAEAAYAGEKQQTAFTAAAAAAGVKPGLTTTMLYSALSGQVKIGEDGGMTVGAVPVADALGKLKETDGHLFGTSNGANLNPTGPKDGKPSEYSADTHDDFAKMSPDELVEYAKEHANDLNV